MEFGNVGCSFPEEELGYLWFKYPVSVFCGANTDTNVLRGVGGKAKMIYHNMLMGYTMPG